MEKKGYQTSEFWLSFAAILVGAIVASGVLDATSTNVDNQIVGLIVTVLTALGYTASRGFVKANARKADALVAVAKANPSPPSP